MPCRAQVLLHRLLALIVAVIAVDANPARRLQQAAAAPPHPPPPQSAVAPAPAPVAGPPETEATATYSMTTLEIYYGVHCPNCLIELQLGLQPLLSAGLPGTQVRAALLPWTTGQFGQDGLYVPTPGDVPAFSHVCALRDTGFPVPAPIDSPAFIKASNFILCDLEHIINPDLERTEETAKACALQQGLAWDGPTGIRTCTDGGPASEGFRLMHSADYSGKIKATQRMPGPPESSTPFIYLDEHMLTCPGPTYCTGIWSWGGMQPFPSPGPLQKVICMRLSPRPSICQSLLQPSSTATPGSGFKQECENCAELGSYHWHETEAGPRLGVFALLFALVLPLFILMALVAWRRSCKKTEAHQLLDASEEASPLDEPL